ncbi:hypothetical protein K402DRAFT_417991 [Aulographum hederae CBS 113979]|uniref:Uncharacterized protein n=1 Tax=Aulographum hederae CBS 113979 TaxID=1176131 RepID=A0A6G1H9G7_9PEZI|nr:hypothetical protein K402DRAFT_417991 [Aulographum hederae CBS 113979]
MASVGPSASFGSFIMASVEQEPVGPPPASSPAANSRRHRSISSCSRGEPRMGGIAQHRRSQSVRIRPLDIAEPLQALSLGDTVSFSRHEPPTAAGLPEPLAPFSIKLTGPGALPPFSFGSPSRGTERPRSWHRRSSSIRGPLPETLPSFTFGASLLASTSTALATTKDGPSADANPPPFRRAARHRRNRSQVNIDISSIAAAAVVAEPAEPASPVDGVGIHIPRKVAPSYRNVREATPEFTRRSQSPAAIERERRGSNPSETGLDKLYPTLAKRRSMAPMATSSPARHSPLALMKIHEVEDSKYGQELGKFPRSI